MATTDDFISQAFSGAPGPDFGEEVLAFRGYRSESPLGQDYQRLFVGQSLNEFIDYKLADELGNATPGASTDPSIVWIRKSASIYHTQVRSLSSLNLGGFLQGPIATSYIQQPGAQAGYPIIIGGGGGFGTGQGSIGSIIGYGCGTASQGSPCVI